MTPGKKRIESERKDGMEGLSERAEGKKSCNLFINGSVKTEEKKEGDDN